MVTDNKIPEGYKQTEVGVIPEDWDLKKLGTIGVFRKGRNISKHQLTSEGIPCVLYGEIYTRYNFVSRKLTSYISHLSFQRATPIQKGDILFAGSGETAEDIGKCFTYLGEAVACAGGDLNILTPQRDNPEFLGYLLNSGQIQEQKANLGQGSSVVHIYINNLKCINVPLPPLHEQTAIANVLSDVDSLITSLDKVIAKKKDIKQGAMQELLTGKKRLPGFSGDWEVQKLGEIFSVTAGGDLKKDIFSVTKDEKYPYPIYSNALSNSGLYGFSSSYEYDKDCITVTARGTIGVASSRDHKFNAIGRVLVLTPSTNLNCEFISEYINSRVTFSVESTGVPQLTAPQISKYDVAFPSLPEQTAIAQILSDMDTEINQLEQKRDKYKDLKQAMMQQLLTGKIRLV